jgi:hypothetical protein
MLTVSVDWAKEVGAEEVWGNEPALVWDWERGKVLEVGGKPNGAVLAGRTGVVGMKKNCCVCGESGSPWKLDMLGLGRLGSLYGRGELRSGAGGRLFEPRYGIAVLLLVVLLVAPLVVLLFTVVLATPAPCFSRVSMENPNDWDLLRLKGDAKGP